MAVQIGKPKAAVGGGGVAVAAASDPGIIVKDRPGVSFLQSEPCEHPTHTPDEGLWLQVIYFALSTMIFPRFVTQRSQFVSLRVFVYTSRVFCSSERAFQSVLCP